jgi:hypothetical protein
MEWIFKKHLIFTLVGVLILLLAYFLFILLFPISKSNHSSSTSTTLTNPSRSCPKDYCGDWVLGSCIGKNERYKERECYNYPDKDMKPDECEANKKIYYEKGSQFDETC